MKNAHNFSRLAKGLRDDGNVIRPKLRELLEDIAEYSEVCQAQFRGYGFPNYVLCEADRVPVRMVRIRDRGRIDEFSGRFVSLRRELDSVIGATAAKVVDELRT